MPLAEILVSCCALSIEIDTLEYQQTEKIETELKDVDRIRIRKVYACCPGHRATIQAPLPSAG